MRDFPHGPWGPAHPAPLDSSHTLANGGFSVMRNRDWNGDGFTAARVSLASFLAQAGVSYRPEYGASPDFPRCLAAQTVHVKVCSIRAVLACSAIFEELIRQQNWAMPSLFFPASSLFGHQHRCEVFRTALPKHPMSVTAGRHVAFQTGIFATFNGCQVQFSEERKMTEGKSTARRAAEQTGQKTGNIPGKR